MVNALLKLIRLYLKYKNQDLGMKLSLALLAGGFASLLSGVGWQLLVSFKVMDLPVSIDLTPGILNYFGGVCVIVGGVLGVRRMNFLEQRITGILIIHRGMEGMQTIAIENALPPSFKKGRLDILDLRESHQLVDGRILSPERALDVVNTLDQQLRSRIHGEVTDNVKIAYGGLAPIPLLVTAGYKISSRQHCLVLDFSRTSGWHCLDDADDDEVVSVIEPPGEIKHDAAVVLPLSVDIAASQLPDALSNKAYFIRLANGARMDSLNSEDKQQRVLKNFYILCANMKATHPEIQTIHVYLASQASFAFRLGTIITSSVMPAMAIYQYDSYAGQYGWGVLIKSGHKPHILVDRA